MVTENVYALLNLLRIYNSSDCINGPYSRCIQ